MRIKVMKLHVIAFFKAFIIVLIANDYHALGFFCLIRPDDETIIVDVMSL